ncbi:hypothetical protein GCM10009630_57990 [Kribbella jejuensis]
MQDIGGEESGHVTVGQYEKGEAEECQGDLPVPAHGCAAPCRQRERKVDSWYGETPGQPSGALGNVSDGDRQEPGSKARDGEGRLPARAPAHLISG